MGTPRTKKKYIGFVVAAILTTLPAGTATADQVVAGRAQRVCAAIGQTGASPQRAFNVDNLTVRRDANGSVTLERGGSKLGEIAQSSYGDRTVCFVEVMALISPIADTEVQAAQRLSPPRRHFD